MITFEIFLTGLLIVSAFTGLVTEGVKKMLTGTTITCPANILAAIVSVVLAVGLGVGYVILSGMSFTANIVVCIVALAFAGWLCAMVGYDKVIGSFKSFKK